MELRQNMSKDDTKDWIEAKLPNLALKRFGASVGDVSDDFFAPLERLIDHNPPIFIPDKYDENGKWMDGWESQRRRNSKSDWGDIHLGTMSIISSFCLDTSHFTGNFAPSVKIEGDSMGSGIYQDLLAPSTLGANSKHFFNALEHDPVDKIRIHLLPDGGIARFQAFGLPYVKWTDKLSVNYSDIACIENGGRIIAYSDSHFGDPWALIAANDGIDMGDGWETRRRRSPGFDWIIIALGTHGIIKKIVIDTSHFKGNYPPACYIKAANIPDDTPSPFVVANSIYWEDILPAHDLQPDQKLSFDQKQIINNNKPYNFVRLSIVPDGGVSRLRIFAEPQPFAKVPNTQSTAML